MLEYSVGDLEPASFALYNKMTELAVRRQKGSGFVRTAKWALYNGREFQRLSEDVARLTANLEALFPAPLRQTELISDDIAQLKGSQQLQLLATAARDVDENLAKAADGQARLGGHLYVDVKVRGMAHNGDAFGNDWQHGSIGESHTYNGVVVDEGGKALNGNQYGQEGLWTIRRAA